MTKKQYTKEFLISEIERFIYENNRVPTKRDMCIKNGYPSSTTFKYYFGSWNNALLAAGIDKHPYTRDELIAEIHRFIRENNRVPVWKDMCKKNGYPSNVVFKKVFGSWHNALMAANVEFEYGHIHIDNGVCPICEARKQKYKIAQQQRFLNTRQYYNGELNPLSTSGKGVITEYIVCEILGDCINCNKDNFHSNFDLISESLGTINVKSSRLAKFKNRNIYYWQFSKTIKQKIPDLYICLGLNEDRSEILHVWFIPGNSNTINKRGIYISYNNLTEMDEFEVECGEYKRMYGNLNIMSLEEFKKLVEVW